MSKLGQAMIGVIALCTLVVALTMWNTASIAAGETAQDPPPLFNHAAEPDGYEPPYSPEIIRSRLVSVNLGLLSDPKAGQVLLNLFDDASFQADRHREAGRKHQNFTWVGHLQDVEHGQVTLVVRNGEVMVGNIILAGTIYQVRYLGDGIHLVSQLDDRSLPPHHDPIPVTPSSQTKSGDTLVAVAEGEDDGSIIDLMVVYTPAARIAEGGTPAIEALINLAVEETNIAFANSQIAPRLRLVHTAEVNYTESGNMGTDLSRFRGKTDDYMDDVHAWRDAYAADQISLIESTGNYCGIAYLMSNVGSYFELLLRAPRAERPFPHRFVLQQLRLHPNPALFQSRRSVRWPSYWN